MPAKLATQLAENGKRVDPSKHKPKFHVSQSPSTPETEEEDAGGPIRLTSTEIDTNGQSHTTDSSPDFPASANKHKQSPLASDSQQQVSLPGPAQLPMVSPLPDLTKVGESEIPNATNQQTAALPKLSPPVNDSPTQGDPDQLRGLAVSQETSSTLHNSTSSSASSPETMTSLPASEEALSAEVRTADLTKRVDVSPQQPVPSPDLPVSPEVAPAGSTAIASSELQAGGVAMVSAAGGGKTPLQQPAVVIDDATPASSSPSDELPPLPPDLGERSNSDVSPRAAPVAQASEGLGLSKESSSDDELPPLPPDLGRPPLSLKASAGNAVQMSQPVQAGPSLVEQSADATPMPVKTGSSPTPTLASTLPTIDEPLPKPKEKTAGSELSSSSLSPSSGSSSEITPSVSPPAGTTITGTQESALPITASNPMPANLQHPTDPAASSIPEPNVAAEPLSSVDPTNRSEDSKVAVSSPVAVTASSESTPNPSELPSALPPEAPSAGTAAFIPEHTIPPTTLKPELQREVERIARTQEDEMHRKAQNPTQPVNPTRDSISSDLRTQTQMDISRAPVQLKAQPIKAIPVPEDWVPLGPRNWSPQRKYWAAAATCHLPLYFQDPVLERYGHSVEQFVGPIGRFLTYPVDDPTQSTQRNQILQPFFSAGLMGLQIIAWPYNLIMDPPWEAQYDLGYYRPGDNIPTDTYWLPLHGYGPPLRGSNY